MIQYGNGLSLFKMMSKVLFIFSEVPEDFINSDELTSTIVHERSVVLESGDKNEVSPEPGKVDTNIKNIAASCKIKKKKGIRSRDEEKKKKDHGLSYKTRQGKVKPAVSYKHVAKEINVMS